MRTTFIRYTIILVVTLLMTVPVLRAQGGPYAVDYEANSMDVGVQAMSLRSHQVPRTLMVTTEDGVFEHHAYSDAAGAVSPAPVEKRSTTLWQVDDEIAIAEGVAIDDSNTWGAWRFLDGRLSAYPSTGDGTPDFEFSTFDVDNGSAGVASASGADRVLFIEGSFDGEEYWVHAFTSQSDGVPDWSFELINMSGLTINFRRIAVSYDGSTAAAIGRDIVAETYTLYIFDADTGDVLFEWVDDAVMNAVELSDDGSIALLTQQNLATVIDTDTGNTLFQTSGSGAGAIHYRMSGDGGVVVVGGFDLHVYEFDGESYEQVIDFTLESSWFGLSSIVSRDGSTVGALARTTDTSWLNLEAVFLDVKSGEILGSHPVSGSGGLQGSPRSAASNDDGSVMAFASWGTENQDWPEIMVFNRDAELIGAIDFPGSGLNVDVSADGQYVVGGAKAVHANIKGSGGRIELIEIAPDGNPIPVLGELEPDAVVVGSEEIALMVSGSGFRADSVVRFDGDDRSTTFVDSETLTAELPASDLDTVGSFLVAVFNPEPGGGESQPLDFEVLPLPPPVIDVDPDMLSLTLPAGQTYIEPLTISNLGEDVLEWEVAEGIRSDGGQLLRPAGAVTIPPTVDQTAGPGMGADLAHSTTGNGSASHPFVPRGDQITITHSDSLDVTGQNSLACSPDDGQTTTDNQFLRVFELEDFDIDGDFDVTEVSFGVEILREDPVELTVNLYTLEGDFIYDNMTLIGNATEEVSPQDLTVVDMAVMGTAPAGSTLVVEVAAPDLSGVGAFFVGTNTAGESAPSYIVSDSCEIFDPVTFASLGAANVHTVMTVTGEPGEGEPVECTLPEWLSADPASGKVASGDNEVVDVAFDSTGLAEDVYEANLCIASNDPSTSLVVVPVTLTVEGAPGELAVSPDTLNFGKAEIGDSPARTFTVTNAAEAGAGALLLSAPEVAGDAAFTLTGGGCEAGTELLPQESCEVEVTFSPDAEAMFSGEATVTADGQSATVDLSGTGVDELADDIFEDRFELEE